MLLLLAILGSYRFQVGNYFLQHAVYINRPRLRNCIYQLMSRVPTRACVMSVLIVAIRTLFYINGYGTWESSFSSASCSSPRVKNEDNESESRSIKTEYVDDDSDSHNTEPPVPRMSVLQLLKILDAKYNELSDTHEYSRDLPTYLQYCKDVVFCGLNSSFEDVEEKELIEEVLSK